MHRHRWWMAVLLLCPLFLVACGDDDDNPVVPANKADLVVQSVTFDPAAPTTAQAVTATIVVKNNGTAGSVASTVEVKTDGTVTCASVPVAAIAVGGQATVTCALGVLTAGDHPVQACADKGSAVDESSETNNCTSATLTVTASVAGPDLVIQNLTYDPPSPTPQQSVTATVTVKNIGTAAAAASTAEVKLDDVTTCAAIAVPGLAVNEEANVTCVLGTLAAGAYTVLAIADAAGTITETGETNNSHAWTLTVAGGTTEGPDLVVETVAFDPAAPNTNDAISVRVTVRNTGDEAAIASDLSVEIDGVVECAGIDAGALQPNGAIVLTCSLAAQAAGTHTVRACADAGSAVTETDETNNCLEAAVIVTQATAGADLFVDSITFTPLVPGPSDPITATVVVYNAGDAEAAGSDVRVSFAGVVSCPAGAVGAIAPGGTATFQCALGAHAGGDYSVEACADFGEVVAESNETNNCTVETVTVLADDIEFPPIPAVPMLQLVNLNSNDPDAIAADQQIEQFYLMPAALMASIGPAIVKAIEDFDWEDQGGDCWTFSEVEGSCTYTYRMCKVGNEYQLESKATGNCDEGTGLQDFVTWSGTLSLDGRTGEVFSFEQGVTGPVSTWNWLVSADQNTGAWRGYEGTESPENLDWSFDFQRATNGDQRLDWMIPDGMRWTLDVNEAGTVGDLNADVPGDSGWEDFEEIEWEADGHGSWTKQYTEPPTVLEW